MYVRRRCAVGSVAHIGPPTWVAGGYGIRPYNNVPGYANLLAPPLGELSPKVTERAERPWRFFSILSDRKTQSCGFALSVFSLRSNPPLPEGEVLYGRMLSAPTCFVRRRYAVGADSISALPTWGNPYRWRALGPGQPLLASGQFTFS